MINQEFYLSQLKLFDQAHLLRILNLVVDELDDTIYSIFNLNIIR